VGQDGAVRIEPARPDDLDRILDVRWHAFADQAPLAYSPADVRTLLADVDPAELAAMIDDGRLFVARLDDDGPGGPAIGSAVGSAGWQDDQLRHVYVEPGHFRQGIGRALVRRAESDLHARTGLGVIRAGVSLHAEAFYRAAGYRLVRRAVAWDGSGYLEMDRRIGP
jgi:GNAT superfamily N-acetyltransferase